ncbi:coiled-coil domain-containing protein 181-like isoform X2 [Polyodon spathula]|uniref:coiled-coil domain-containing protein 181-like isoform X2 n=1 Tax=Polyodon spathula TaxID=7913 RepID=UPI001B7E4304|nr:coiled-coil domain-containing protein 181-like isoform X2 [Polyodon spathula]
MNPKEEISNTSQEEYEDDFEKDLDWLINEEGKASEDLEDESDIEAQIDRELEEEAVKKKTVEKEQQDHSKSVCDKNSDLKSPSGEEPPPEIEPPEPISDTDSESSYQLIKPEEVDDEMDEEAKKYIMEKIEQANRQLEDEDPVNENRERRLKFKDSLVDFVAPPLAYSEGENDNDGEVAGQLSDLQISPQKGQTFPENMGKDHSKEGKVLIEKDGKFELVSINDLESQGLLPPIPCAASEAEQKQSSPRASSRHSESCPVQGLSSRLNSASTFSSSAGEFVHVPRPPSAPKGRSSSAGHVQRNTGKRITKARRVQSANICSGHTTYAQTPEQKEMRLKLEQKRERLRREEEARKREEEEQKRQDNENAFHAWMMKKKDQLQEERRIHRAREMERMNNTESPDAEEAFKQWLKRKHEQQLRDRQIEEMRRQEEESSYYVHEREECEKAFKLWLRRKKAEKHAEKQAAKERSRRLVIEARRARRMKDLLYTISEAKAFKFVDNYGYRF